MNLTDLRYDDFTYTVPCDRRVPVIRNGFIHSVRADEVGGDDLVLRHAESLKLKLGGYLNCMKAGYTMTLSPLLKRRNH